MWVLLQTKQTFLYSNRRLIIKKSKNILWTTCVSVQPTASSFPTIIITTKTNFYYYHYCNDTIRLRNPYSGYVTVISCCPHTQSTNDNVITQRALHNKTRFEILYCFIILLTKEVETQWRHINEKTYGGRYYITVFGKNTVCLLRPLSNGHYLFNDRTRMWKQAVCGNEHAHCIQLQPSLERNKRFPSGR